MYVYTSVEVVAGNRIVREFDEFVDDEGTRGADKT